MLRKFKCAEFNQSFVECKLNKFPHLIVVKEGTRRIPSILNTSSGRILGKFKIKCEGISKKDSEFRLESCEALILDDSDVVLIKVNWMQGVTKRLMFSKIFNKRFNVFWTVDFEDGSTIISNRPLSLKSNIQKDIHMEDLVIMDFKNKFCMNSKFSYGSNDRWVLMPKLIGRNNKCFIYHSKNSNTMFPKMYYSKEEDMNSKSTEIKFDCIQNENSILSNDCYYLKIRIKVDENTYIDSKSFAVNCTTVTYQLASRLLLSISHGGYFDIKTDNFIIQVWFNELEIDYDTNSF